MKDQLTIYFDDVQPAEANKLAAELNIYLHSMNDVTSEITKESEDTQDGGTILTIILGSAPVLAIVTGLTTWLVKKQNRKITIKKNGDIIGENLSSKDIEKFLNKLN